MTLRKNGRTAISNKPIMASGFLISAEMAALGAVVVESAHLEDTLDRIIMGITHLKRQQYIAMMGGRMIGAKLGILKELGLLKLRSKENRQRAFGALMDQLSALNGERTIAVHGLWAPTGGTLLILRERVSEKWPVEILPTGEAVHMKGKKKTKIKAERLAALATTIAGGRFNLFCFWRDNWMPRGNPEVTSSKTGLTLTKVPGGALDAAVSEFDPALRRPRSKLKPRGRTRR
jgi:hypothetical protein